MRFLLSVSKVKSPDLIETRGLLEPHISLQPNSNMYLCYFIVYCWCKFIQISEVNANGDTLKWLQAIKPWSALNLPLIKHLQRLY